jgi:hypothetical protein
MRAIPARRWIFDQERLAALGVTVDNHGKMPDVVLHYVSGIGCFVEAVTSHGLWMPSAMLNWRLCSVDRVRA